MIIPPEQHCIANMREHIQVLQILVGKIQSPDLKNQLLGKFKQLNRELENLNTHVLS